MKTRARNDARRTEIGAGQQFDVMGAQRRHERLEAGQDCGELLLCENSETADRRIEPRAVSRQRVHHRVDGRGATGWLGWLLAREDSQTAIGYELEVLDAPLTGLRDLDRCEAGRHMSDEGEMSCCRGARDREVRLAR